MGTLREDGGTRRYTLTPGRRGRKAVGCMIQATVTSPVYKRHVYADAESTRKLR
jgi:hypothetical protein